MIDETSHTDQVHLLVAGLAYRGIVVPLLVRARAQNTPLPDGAYRAQVQALLSDVRELLPPEVRTRVLLIADRGFGTPWMLDLLATLGWGWLLRVQGQPHVRLRDGSIRSLQSLTPHPGTTWFGAFDPDTAPATDPPDEMDSPPIDVFQTAGWRQSQGSPPGRWARRNPGYSSPA